MTGALFLGWRYLAFHKLKSGILLASVTLMLFLPAATRLLVEDSAQAMTARADQTPLVVGASGSPLELILNSLYFHPDHPPPLPFSVADEMRETQLARVIPMYSRYRAQGAPIVGTTLDYFEFRSLSLASGRWMGLLGECVIGSGLAAQKGLRPGDSVLSSPETVFDIAGVYPLKMKVTGVLEPSGSPDDEAVFIDYRTAWVIEGLGHGHSDLAEPGAAASVLNRREGLVTANAALVEFAEITPENVSEFHFHGDTSGFPLTSIILAPPDAKNAALMRGRYQENDLGLQMVVPSSVLDDLLATVFTVQNYVILGLALLSLATIAVITLVFLLSQQLRRGEFHTLSRIGASRGYIAVLVASEIGFVLLASIALSTVLTLVVRQYALQIFQSFLSL